MKVPSNTQLVFVTSLSFLVIGNSRGTCSSVEMLKGYMVKERLGTPGINNN